MKLITKTSFLIGDLHKPCRQFSFSPHHLEWYCKTSRPSQLMHAMSQVATPYTECAPSYLYHAELAVGQSRPIFGIKAGPFALKLNGQRRALLVWTTRSSASLFGFLTAIYLTNRFVFMNTKFGTDDQVILFDWPYRTRPDFQMLREIIAARLVLHRRDCTHPRCIGQILLIACLRACPIHHHVIVSGSCLNTRLACCARYREGAECREGAERRVR